MLPIRRLATGLALVAVALGPVQVHAQGAPVSIGGPFEGEAKSLNGAYPISTATWLLMYREIGVRAKALSLTPILWWATHEGQQFNNDLAYATVPAELTARRSGCG